MINELIEQKNRFVDKFTEETNMGMEYWICSEMESEYLQWLSKLATYSEGNLKKKYLDMTVIVLVMAKNQSREEKDFNIISGYLDAVKEQKDIIKVNTDAIWKLNN